MAWRGDVGFLGLSWLSGEIELTQECSWVQFLLVLGFWVSQHRWRLVIQPGAGGAGGHP